MLVDEASRRRNGPASEEAEGTEELRIGSPRIDASRTFAVAWTVDRRSLGWWLRNGHLGAYDPPWMRLRSRADVLPRLRPQLRLWILLAVLLTRLDQPSADQVSDQPAWNESFLIVGSNAKTPRGP